MNRIKSLGFISALLVVAVTFLFVAIPKSHAMSVNSWNYNGQEHKTVWGDYNQPMAQVSGDQNFFMQHGYWQWQWNNNDQRFEMVYPTMGFPQRVIVYDQDNPGSEITIENSNFLTGPNSVNINEADIYVSHYVFESLSQSVDQLSNVNLSVNTGNNTISYNTVTGNVTTGAVSVSVW